MSDAETNLHGRANAEDSSQNIDSSIADIGAQLRAQREAHGWSIDQVSSRLNLAPRQVQALEDNNFAALPGMASTRGFIRAYAKLLKIDSEPMVAALAAKQNQTGETLQVRPSLATPFSDTVKLPSLGNAAPSSKYMLWSVGAVLVAVTVFVVTQTDWLPLPGKQSPARVSEPVVQQAESDTGVVIADPSVPEMLGTGENPAAPNQNAEVASVPSTNQTPSVAAETPAVEANAGANALILKMREDSWIEIRRLPDASTSSSSGSLVLSRLARAGTTETVEVNGPMIMTVGNAGGVDATLRGEPLNLTTSARSNVARVNLK